MLVKNKSEVSLIQNNYKAFLRSCFKIAAKIKYTSNKFFYTISKSGCGVVLSNNKSVSVVILFIYFFNVLVHNSINQLIKEYLRFCLRNKVFFLR